MTWNYDGLLATSDRDWIRSRIGDVLENDPQLTDEEIAALLTLYSTKEVAALEAVKRLKARYSRLVDKSGDSISESLSQRVAHYEGLIEEITEELGGTGAAGGGLRATGTSVARRTSVRADTDRIHPPARRSQFSRHDDSDISD